jgi:hypothetical protein
MMTREEMVDLLFDAKRCIRKSAGLARDDDALEFIDKAIAALEAEKPLAVKTGTMVYNGANYGWGVYVPSVHEDLELDINHQHKVRIIILEEAAP